MSLLFFWQNAPGGNVGLGQSSGQAIVSGVGTSTGGPTGLPVITLKILVELGLGFNGQTLRRVLVNQENNVACLTHSELVPEFGLRDISGRNNHGSIEGAFTHGWKITDSVEGGVGCFYHGFGQTRIPNDGLTGGPNLSFAGGDFDIFLYFSTFLNDSFVRGVVTKYDGANGWWVYLRNGNLTGGFRAGGAAQEATSSFVADGNYKRAHLCFTGGQLRWTINGVQGTPVSATGEPIPTSSDVLIGGWSNLSNTPNDRFQGAMHYVMLGREGNSQLGINAEAAMPWTDVSDDVCALNVLLGSEDETPLGTTAVTGKASFKLLNSKPLGRYSPGHASALNGFNLGNPIRIQTFDGINYRPLFRGMISDINPTTGINNDRQTAVDCVDWMEVLAVSPIGPVGIVLNRTSDYCAKRVIDVVDRPPVAVDFDLGNEVFPVAFDQVDGIQGKALQEISEITYNEGGQFYIKRDGTVRNEGRQRRQLPTTPVVTLFGDWKDIEVGMGLHNVINVQRATVYPREVGNDTQTVVSGATPTDSEKRRQELIPGEIVPIQGSYRDPEERAAQAGATDIQTLIPYVDYTMTEMEDGGGLDLTGFVEFISGNPPQAGSSYKVEVRNNSSVTGHFHMQIRGRILRRFDTQTTFFEDVDSKNQFLPREPPTMNLRYLSDLASGLSRCKYMVGQYKQPKLRPRVMTSLLNPSTTVMTNFLDFELGAFVTVSEPVTAISNIGYWIQGMQYSFQENNILTMRVNLLPSSISGAIFIVGDASLGVVGTAIVGY